MATWLVEGPYETYPSGVDRLFRWGELCQAERLGSGCLRSVHLISWWTLS